MSAHHLRSRRQILGLSQRELAERVGVTQPFIAAAEAGRRGVSEDVAQRLESALAIRPSLALAARRGEVVELFDRAHLPTPRVFGSVARGQDDVSSDLDLVVEFDDRHDIADLLQLEHDLSELLSVEVDIVDARADGPVVERARAESVRETERNAERVERRLADLAAFGQDAAFTVSLGERAYLDDSPHGRLLRNNGRHIVIQVATVAVKLPDAFKDAHSDVDWVAITRMRNLIAHHYDRVDGRLVFAALRSRIPDLLRSLSRPPA